MQDGDRSLDERVSSLETAVSTINKNVEHIALKLDAITRTPWSHIIGFVGIILTMVGSAYLIYTRDQERVDRTFTALDANLQREQRQLDDRIIEQVHGLRELRAVAHAALAERVGAVETQLRQGLNERWSKADHIEYDHARSKREEELLRRIERLEAFYMQGDKR